MALSLACCCALLRVYWEALVMPRLRYPPSVGHSANMRGTRTLCTRKPQMRQVLKPSQSVFFFSCRLFVLGRPTRRGKINFKYRAQLRYNRPSVQIIPVLALTLSTFIDAARDVVMRVIVPYYSLYFCEQKLIDVCYLRFRIIVPFANLLQRRLPPSLSARLYRLGFVLRIPAICRFTVL